MLSWQGEHYSVDMAALQSCEMVMTIDQILHKASVYSLLMNAVIHREVKV